MKIKCNLNRGQFLLLRHSLLMAKKKMFLKQIEHKNHQKCSQDSNAFDKQFFKKKHKKSHGKTDFSYENDYIGKA